jgi:hypothetical protein
MARRRQTVTTVTAKDTRYGVVSSFNVASPIDYASLKTGKLILVTTSKKATIGGTPVNANEPIELVEGRYVVALEDKSKPARQATVVAGQTKKQPL